MDITQPALEVFSALEFHVCPLRMCHGPCWSYLSVRLSVSMIMLENTKQISMKFSTGTMTLQATQNS
jgi:hypothetical protein